MKHLSILTLCGVLATLSGGCALLGRGVPDEVREERAALRYPADAPYGPDLDVRLLRKGKIVRVVNREPRTFRDGQLWLNRQYVRPVEMLAIGNGNRFELSRFINRYEESFPLAELLAPDESAPLVLAELYDPEANVRHRLTVQPIIDRDLVELAAGLFTPPAR
jgi:hypothetical protein